MARYSKFIYWLPALVWMVIIFSFSAHPTMQASTIDWQDFLVKKTAHFLEYAVLTALYVYALIKSTHLPRIRALILAAVFSVGFAASDEFHQSFVPGREPRIRDVFIDAIGSLTLVILWWHYKWLDTDHYRV